MPDPIRAALRREVRQRAFEKCEYCLVPEPFLLAGCEVDHVISVKHGGLTESRNLAMACARCNRAKGSDVGSIHRPSGQFVRLYNPRTDVWHEHFLIEDNFIIGRTMEGQVTVELLRLNSGERVAERRLLSAAGLLPKV